MRLPPTLTVDGKIWEINHKTLADFGQDAHVFTSPSYPDLVLMIFSIRASYKYDWLKFLDLIYGESTYQTYHILILPKMVNVSNPEWYYALIDEIHGMPISYSVELLETLIYKAGRDNDKPLKYWAETLLEFVHTHPKYEHGKYLFDLQPSNIMMFKGEYVIIDPIYG